MDGTVSNSPEIFHVTLLVDADNKISPPQNVTFLVDPDPMFENFRGGSKVYSSNEENIQLTVSRFLHILF